jgi:hypothetical protein
MSGRSGPRSTRPASARQRRMIISAVATELLEETDPRAGRARGHDRLGLHTMRRLSVRARDGEEGGSPGPRPRFTFPAPGRAISSFQVASARAGRKPSDRRTDGDGVTSSSGRSASRSRVMTKVEDSPHSRRFTATMKIAPGFLARGPIACSYADTSRSTANSPRHASSHRALNPL